MYTRRSRCAAGTSLLRCEGAGERENNASFRGAFAMAEDPVAGRSFAVFAISDVEAEPPGVSTLPSANRLSLQCESPHGGGTFAHFQLASCESWVASAPRRANDLDFLCPLRFVN